MSDVRHMTTARDASIGALGAFEHRVATWDLDAFRKIAEFETVLDFGGERLSLSPDGAMCAAAAYGREGLATYDARSGTPLWHRADLTQLQRVSFSADGAQLYCGFERRPYLVLESRSGATVRSLRGVRRIWTAADGLEFRDAHRPYIARATERSAAYVERSTFAFLDVAFGPDAVCTTESGGPVRCFDHRGRELWRVAMQPGEHALSLTYSAAADEFYGVVWPFAHGGPKMLWRFDRASGQSGTVAAIGTVAETAFFNHGTRLLASTGVIIETTTGRIQGRLGNDLQLSLVGA